MLVLATWLLLLCCSQVLLLFCLWWCHVFFVALFLVEEVWFVALKVKGFWPLGVTDPAWVHLGLGCYSTNGSV